MYAIYAYIDPSNHPNVGIYGIHGVFGYTNWDPLGAFVQQNSIAPFSSRDISSLGIPPHADPRTGHVAQVRPRDTSPSPRCSDSGDKSATCTVRVRPARWAPKGTPKHYTMYVFLGDELPGMRIGCVFFNISIPDTPWDGHIC